MSGRITIQGEHHRHYDHYDVGMARRLDGFFGSVDARMNERIGRFVRGRTLDFGCGFGSLVEHLRRMGIEAEGVDQLSPFIEEGKRRFPKAALFVSRSELPDFEPGRYDTLVLKDAIHHIHGEGDSASFFREAARLGVKRIVVMDPNPMPILLMARRLIGHVDPVCPPQAASRILEGAGYEVVALRFHDTMALALSGGYVGKPLTPGGLFGKLVLWMDRALELLFRALGIHRFFCWRYLLVAERKVR